MKKILLGLLIAALSPLTHAQEEYDQIPDGLNPSEIYQELQQENPELFMEGDFRDLVVPAQSSPRIYVVINKAARAQNMTVYIDGQLTYNWRVSTGRERRENPPSGRKYYSGTPVGSWTPYGMTRLHRSRTWDADMPYSIWLVGGIAIHAAAPAYESRLGSRASGGCIRLSYRNAQTLYSLVQQYGRANTRVQIVNK